MVLRQEAAEKMKQWERKMLETNITTSLCRPTHHILQTHRHTHGTTFGYRTWNATLDLRFSSSAGGSFRFSARRSTNPDTPDDTIGSFQNAVAVETN